MLSPEMLNQRNHFHNALCRHDVVVEHCTSAGDGYGDKTYASPVTYKARVEDVSKLVQAGDGQMAVAGGKITFALPSPVITLNDRITVPTASGTPKRIGKIMDMKQDPTGSGQQPTVVYY